MVTQTSNQLSHDEAIELLPWHVNASLEAPLSDLVAHHIEQCDTCKEESAVLSSTIVALNSDQAVSTNLDGRFSQLLDRVRTHEREQQSSAPETKPSLASIIAQWLGLSTSRAQWAGACMLGLAVALGVLMTSLQVNTDNTDPANDYVVHQSGESQLRLQVDFGAAPNAQLLDSLTRAAGRGAEWQQQSTTRFLIRLPDNTTVKSVADLRSELLAYDAVVAVAIDVNSADPALD